MSNLTWNIPTVIVFAIVCLLTALALWKIIIDRKNGHLSCGGHCSGCCGNCSACHSCSSGQSGKQI